MRAQLTLGQGYSPLLTASCIRQCTSTAGIVVLILTLNVFAPRQARGQAPSGIVAGRIEDQTGAAIPAARVVIRNKQTGAGRTVAAAAQGNYSASALQPGNYEVSVEAPGFKQLLRDATVQAGTTTIIDFILSIGTRTEILTVKAAPPQVRTDTHTVTGVVLRSQIDGLPLNGRSFLELAKLEPGAQQPTRASNNRMFLPLLGAPEGQNGRGTRVTVDGGSIMEIGNGGSAMDFSQEVVQEFQVSTVNFDPSTGVTASGAANIVTRSGGNQFHGALFDFFRSHKFSAYPGLSRNTSDPNPFFQRQQYGLAIGGPIRKYRSFFFGNFERNDQRGVISTNVVTPEFTPLNRLTSSPTTVNQFSIRLDYRLSEKNFLFLRYSHEDVFSFAPTTLTRAGESAYPSAWTRQPSRADQSILGWTAQVSTKLVNDLRFSYFFVSSSEQAPQESDCPACLGIGAPSVTVMPDLFIGTSLTTTVLGRRFHINEIVAWQKGAHRIRFGGDLEQSRGGRTDLGNQPVTMTLFSPQNVRDYNALSSTPVNLRIPLPSSFFALGDVLQLPLQSFTVGIGNPQVPQAGFGKVRIAPLAHLFFQDTWRLKPRLTFDYGLGWTFDAPLNYDLQKPAYLEPLLGASGLRPTRKDWKEFSPAAGIVWMPSSDGKMVVRGGAGIYYDFQTPFGVADPERVSLGPRGVGRGIYSGAGIRNPLTSVPSVPFGTLLNFPGNPTLFTGADLMEALPAIQASLALQRGDPNNRDFSVTNIEANKQGSVIESYLPSPSSIQASLGLQREVAPDFVISADLVLRQFSHIGGGPGGPLGIDLNHFTAARGPALPICTVAQRSDPKAACSLGPIWVLEGIGSARYLGLLVRAEKRFSHGWQFLGSYALSSNVGNNFGNGFSNDDWLGNYGPLDRDLRHILNLSAMVNLPKRFQLAFLSAYNSKPPFSAYLGTLDLNGDGTTGDLLPGTTVNEFNRGLGKPDLARLVNDFNSNYAGKKDARGRSIPTILLPSSYDLGDRLITNDFRLSRDILLGDRYRLTLAGEVFNAFNLANLSGRSGDLLGAGFGQPTSRITQVFGSGGPRAFQGGARLSF